VQADLASVLETITVEGVSGSPGDGPYIVLSISLSGERIDGIEFRCNGCVAAQKAACGLASFLRGRSVQQAMLLDAHDLGVLIGGVPAGKDKYLAMAIEALHNGIGRSALAGDEKLI
jgi:NifU-like protein involved in Fe-S cluster formation